MCSWVSNVVNQIVTRRPASADRTARRQFQATGQPLSRTQASDAMTSRLPRYEANCVERRCFQCRSVPLRSDVKGMEPPPASILIPLERQLIALQLCRWEFFMVALCNRETIYIFMLWFVLLSSFFSSPNLSRRRFDVCHTSTHGVALVRI